MGFYEKVAEIMTGYHLYSQENVKDKKVLIILHWKMNLGWDITEMSWYLTEFDSVSWDLFCYVENHSDPFCSEWWYSNLKELLKFNCVKSYLDLSKKDSRVSVLLKGLIREV